MSVLTLDIGIGTILCCSKDEARKLWKERPQDRGRIWLQDEVKKYTLADPDELKAAFDKKMAKPGTIL